MSNSSLTIDELKAQSKQAAELIQKLQDQIKQVKQINSPQFVNEKIESLKKENEGLRKKVEELKKDLDDAEAKNGKSNKKKMLKKP